MKQILLLSLSLLITQGVIAQRGPQRNATSKRPATKPEAAKPKPPKQEEVTIKPTTFGDPSKDVVAIYPFTSAQGYDYDYAQSVGNAVEAGFVRSARFNVVERNRFGSIKSEEMFQEVNTSNIVKVAAKLGAKYIITGHITGANTGETYDSNNKFSGYQTSISVAFKIIEVESSLIRISESLIITGRGGSTATAKGAAYASIDGITRRVIAASFPQRFKFMSAGTVETKKTVTILYTFKFWGGSDNGIKPGDAVEIYLLSYATNPTTGKKVEERTNLGIATITAVNSGSTSTCEVYRPKKFGAQIQEAITKTPDLVVIEYSGGQKPKGFWDL